jgi:MFS family permease
MAFRPEEVPLPPDDYVKPPAEVPLLSAKALAPYEWPERVKIVALCFASFVLCNCDRINISVAILPMASTFGWSQSTVGIIQSSFFWGYVTTQIPGGYLSDRYGGRQVLAFGVVAWSLMTVLTPAAASTSLPMLLAARALLGVGEGVAMPAMNQVLSRWVPRGERSKSLSLVYSGMYLGSTIGLLSCPILIANFGWQSVFYCFGAAGGLWWFAWNSFTAGSPQTSSTISESERQYIEEATAPVRPRPLESIPWKMLLSEKATWAIIVAHFCCTWGLYRAPYLDVAFFCLDSTSIKFQFCRVHGAAANMLLPVGLFVCFLDFGSPIFVLYDRILCPPDVVTYVFQHGARFRSSGISFCERSSMGGNVFVCKRWWSYCRSLDFTRLEHDHCPEAHADDWFSGACNVPRSCVGND